MLIKKALFMILFISSSCIHASGRDTIRYTAMTLSNTQIHHIHSNENGVDYKLYINIPATYNSNIKKNYPVLYLLDADYSFPIAKQVSEHMSDRNDIEEIILVGIAYDGPNHYRLHRTRDYTISSTKVGGYSEQIQKYSGGSKKFTNFIQRELIPYIKSCFPVNNSRGIVGHSLGGLFATNILIDNPELFDKYIIISASFWYDDEILLKKAAAKENFNYKDPLHMYIAIGGEENGGDYKMLDEQNEFLKIIAQKDHKNFTITHQVFEKFDHNMIVPAAITRGLKVLYAK